MSLLWIYLVSVLLMLFYYWLDRKNPKYKRMTYGDYFCCILHVFLPCINTAVAVFVPIYVIIHADFWNKRPYDDFH